MPDIFVARKPKSKKAGTPVLSNGERVEPKSNGPQTEIGEKIASDHIENRYSPMASFFLFPGKHINFETKESKEKIILILRRHPVTNVPWLFTATLMIIAPLALNYVPFLLFLPQSYQFMAILAWYLVTTAYILEQFLSWFFNVNIVTDERIIDVDFNNLIYKRISDAKIDKIEDKTYEMGGVVRSIFNYGDVFIQTAAEEKEFDFTAVPQPAKVISILNDLIIEEEQEKIEGRAR